MAETVDLGMPAPHAPGEAWICENGHRHFVCYRCCEVFTADGPPIIEAAPDPGEGTFSCCDECTEIIMERAGAAGLI